MNRAVRDALEENERDDMGKCASCTALANDGEVYCPACKDYWENDWPVMQAPEWKEENDG